MVSPDGYHHHRHGLRALFNGGGGATDAAAKADYAGMVERLCRNGMFFSRSSLGIRRLTSNFPFSTRLM